jgi:hypothetical protein
MSGHGGWLSFLNGSSNAFNFTYRGNTLPYPTASTASTATSTLPIQPSSIPSRVAVAKSNTAPRLHTLRHLRGGRGGTRRRKAYKHRRRTNKNK